MRLIVRAPLLLALAAQAVVAQSPADHRPGAHEALGTVHFAVSCSTAAQPEFERAVALLHHMTYPEAQRAFERVATLDPRCAMAHWGVAMTLFQPLWPTRPGPAALQRGWNEARAAAALAPPTETERLFIASVEAFFLDPASPDFGARVRRWNEALAKLHAAVPDDAEASAFYALSLLATAPANAVSRSHADSAAELLLGVYERNPAHPGAMHYLVHANDMPARASDSLALTRRYEAMAPRNPHALHMPTHIYTRLGDWDGAIRGNLLAAEAALQQPAGERRDMVWDEFPHAVEYLVYAYLQQGADSAAAAQLQRLRGTARLEPTFKTAFHFASTQARWVLEREAWTEAAQIQPRTPAGLDWDRFAWPEAVSQFARGMGAAHTGDVAAAKAAAMRIEELDGVMMRAKEELFARCIRILGLELRSWIAHAEHQRDSSVTLMRAAAELEATTPKPAVTPAPTIPALELLGDLLMEQGQPEGALASYRRSLAEYPRRFRSLLGAARAARALNDAAGARGFYQSLIEVADTGTSRAGIREAKDYLAAPR